MPHLALVVGDGTVPHEVACDGADHEQVVRVGRRTAYERMCHLLLELHHRLSLVGLAQDWRFPMPLTQEILADATSLSIVHVNRTLTQLRREHLVEIRQGHVTLLEPAELISIADFRPPEPSDWRYGAQYAPQVARAEG